VAGLSFIIGPHDLVFDWNFEKEFQERLAKIHEALKGTGILYRVETVSDAPDFAPPIPWPPPMPPPDPQAPPFLGRPPPRFQWKGAYQPSSAGSTESRSRMARRAEGISSFSPFE